MSDEFATRMATNILADPRTQPPVYQDMLAGAQSDASRAPEVDAVSGVGHGAYHKQVLRHEHQLSDAEVAAEKRYNDRQALASYQSLHPAIASAIQGGFAPQPIAAVAPQQPQPQPQYVIHPAIASAVQNGFAPPQQLNAQSLAQANQASTAPLSIPAFASGGIVTQPTLAMVGENGPEAIVPLSNGLDPSIVSGVQNGFQPQQQLQSMPEYPTTATQNPTLPPTQKIGNVGPTPEIPLAPDTTPPSVTGGSLTPPDQQPNSAPVAAPDYKLGTANVPSTPAEVTTANKAYAKQQAQQAAYNASPEGVAAKRDAEQRAAIEKERQAAADATAAEQAQNDATEKALAASRDRQIQQDKLDAAKRAQDQANVDKYTQQYAQQIKDASDYQVDTNRDVGARGMIAIALSGLGDALMRVNGPNAALQIISAAQDKRIADQWAKKKAMGDTAGDTKSVLDVYRRGADDDRQAEQIQRAAEATRTAVEIRQIGAQYANPAARARAELVASGLDQKAASITANLAQEKVAASRQADEMTIKRGELGVAYGHLGLAREQFDEQKKTNDRDFALKVGELEANGDHAQAAALQAQQKAVAERGMFLPPPPSSGRPTVNPDGTVHREPIMQEGNTEAWVAPEKAAEKLGDIQAGALDGIKQIDTLRQMRSDFGGGDQAVSKIFGSEQGRAMMQREAQVIMDMHKISGVNRFSGEIVDLSEKILKGDKNLDVDTARSLMNELDNARGMMLDTLDANMRGPGKYTGKPMADYFPDPVKAKKQELSLGEQLTQPYQAPAEAPTYVAPQPAALPSVINNFGGAPAAPTIAPTTGGSPYHRYVVKTIYDKKK
jgi:hypothetical protein